MFINWYHSNPIYFPEWTNIWSFQVVLLKRIYDSGKFTAIVPLFYDIFCENQNAHQNNWIVWCVTGSTPPFWMKKNPVWIPSIFNDVFSVNMLDFWISDWVHWSVTIFCNSYLYVLYIHFLCVERWLRTPQT